MVDLFNSILLILFSFLIRLPFVLAHTSDEWITWCIIDQQHGRKLHYDITDSVFEGYFATPKLQYYFISRFPKRLWSFVGNLLNIVYDCIAVLLVYFLSSLFFSHYTYTVDTYVMKPAMWVALLYSTTPILLPVTARLKGIKARTLGNLLSLIYFVTFGIAYTTDYQFLYIVTLIAGILTFLSSAFAAQNLALVSLCLSVFYFDWIPLSVFLLTLLVSMLVPGAGVKKILLYKLHHYRWYMKNYKGTAVEERNKLRDFLLFPKYLFVDPVKFLDLTFLRLSPVIALYSVPGLVLLIYFLLVKQDTLGLYLSDSITRYSFMIVSASMLIFILTSLKWLLFLGQAERYFEYSAPFFSLLLTFHLVAEKSSALSLFVLFILHISIIIVIFCYVMRKDFAINLRYSSQQNTLLDEFLLSLEYEIRILTIPLKYSYALSSQFQNLNFKFFHMFVSQGKRGFRYMEEDLEKYNWPRNDLNHFKEKYGINTIVARKSVLETALEQGLYEELAQQQPIFENEDHIVYRL